MTRRKKNGEAEVSLDTPSINVELRNKSARPGSYDRWPLASIEGGIDKISVDRRGNTTIIKIVSPEGSIYADNWKRPKREWRTRRLAQPAPGS